MAISAGDEAPCAYPANGSWYDLTAQNNGQTPMQLDKYDYELPAELVAQHPLKVRDHARMLVMDREQSGLVHVQVRDLVTLLTPRDVLVVNNTKVFPARLLGRRRDTGGRVEILLVRREAAQRWQALVKPSPRLRVGTEVIFEASEWLAIIGAAGADGTRQVEFRGRGSFHAWFRRAGRVPLPPYIKRPNDGDVALSDRRRYQTVYAKHQGSVAAPTAGLHLTRALLRRLPCRARDVSTTA